MNRLEFQKSITNELNIVKDRVRNLIGNRHWGEEGRFKEAVLKSVINRFLPNNLSIGTGFIVSDVNYNNSEISNQIDLILYDNTIPGLFKEGDFIITTVKNVKGIIEVKSKLDITNLRKIIEDFNNLKYNFNLNNRDLFTGIFAYESGVNNLETNINFEELLKIANGSINHIAIGKNYFVKYWNDNRNFNPPVEINPPFYSLYNLNNLSFSYFISNLIHITVMNELDDRYMFSFPIEGTKERYRIKTININ